MNGHLKPTQKTESKPEITETTMQQLPDNELDAVAGGITFSDLLVSSVVKKPENHYVIEMEDILISS